MPSIQSTAQTCRLPQSVDALEAIFNEVLGPLNPVALNTTLESRTIYDILVNTPEVSSLLELVNKHDDIARQLQSIDDGEYTLFAPINSAWEISPAEEQPFPVQDLLQMHISPHYVPVDSFAYIPNIPTVLRSATGNGPQILKLRYSVSAGWSINETAQLIRGNIKAKNGIIHLISAVTLPPGDVLSVMKAHRDLTFMTRAIEASGLAQEISNIKGHTILALHDGPFRGLGSETLSFLLDQEEGRPYLRALVRTHVLPNVTLFSNFIWPHNDNGERITSKDAKEVIKGLRTIPQETLAIRRQDNKPLSVSIEIARYACLVAMMIHGYAKNMDADFAGSNGSMQVTRELLLPRELTDDEMNGRIPTLEGIKAALQDYL